MRRLLAKVITWALNGNANWYEERMRRLLDAPERASDLVWRAKCDFREEISKIEKRLDYEINNHRHGVDGIVMLPKEKGKGVA